MKQMCFWIGISQRGSLFRLKFCESCCSLVSAETGSSTCHRVPETEKYLFNSVLTVDRWRRACLLVMTIGGVAKNVALHYSEYHCSKETTTGCFYLSVILSVSICVYPFVDLSIYLFIYPFICLSYVSMKFVCPFMVFLFVCLFIYLSHHRIMFKSVHQFTCLSFQLPV